MIMLHLREAIHHLDLAISETESRTVALLDARARLVKLLPPEQQTEAVKRGGRRGRRKAGHPNIYPDALKKAEPLPSPTAPGERGETQLPPAPQLARP